MPIGLIVTLRSHGVIALRIMPQSKMRLSFKHPPPTSLIGALAYPLFSGERREVTLSEKGKPKSKADELRSMLLGVAVSSREALMYGPLFKINRLYHGVVESAVTSLPITVTYSDIDHPYRIAYIFDEERLAEYSRRDLERAAWGITRIGSRESIVNVEDVKSAKLEISKANSVKTSFSYSLENVKSVRGKYDVEFVVDWRRNEISDYSRADKIRLAYPLEENEVEGDLTTTSIEGDVIIL